MIAEGKWRPGEKIPPESDLCQLFDVARSTVREALKALAFVGVLKMRHGDGTYVMEGASQLLERAVRRELGSAQSIDDLCEARVALESELVSLCAQRASEEELQGLESLCHEMEMCASVPERFHQLDLEFHLAIARGSKSRILAGLLVTIRELLGELIKKSQEVPHARELACTHHRKVLAAMKHRKPRKAQSAIRTHLTVFQRRYKILQKLESKERQGREQSGRSISVKTSDAQMAPAGATGE
jgi:GntR family transcriptional repressor for pyruvate dehydrogenase complex